MIAGFWQVVSRTCRLRERGVHDPVGANTHPPTSSRLSHRALGRDGGEGLRSSAMGLRAPDPREIRAYDTTQAGGQRQIDLRKGFLIGPV
jgi:hypothetical protein